MPVIQLTVTEGLDGHRPGATLLRKLPKVRTAVEPSDQPPVPRPAVVSFVGIILYAQAFLAAVASISLLIWRNDLVDFLEREGSAMSDGAFSGTIVGEAITAVLLFVVATGLMRGRDGMRLFAAIVQILRMSLAIFVLVAFNVGGYVFSAVFSLYVGVFVLWALYGKEESDTFFAAGGRHTPPRTPTTTWTSSDPTNR